MAIRRNEIAKVTVHLDNGMCVELGKTNIERVTIESLGDNTGAIDMRLVFDGAMWSHSGGFPAPKKLSGGKPVYVLNAG